MNSVAPRTQVPGPLAWALLPIPDCSHFGSDRAAPIAMSRAQQMARYAPMDDAVFLPLLEAFRSAPTYERAEVLTTPCRVPASPGVYGWWFRSLPTPMKTEQCLTRNGLTLLYIGISPKRPPANGRQPSSQTLQDRIRYHFSGNAEGSTLRKTLGVLLSNEIGIELRRVGSGKRMTFGSGEQLLSNWMAVNAVVSWIVHPEPWLVEERLIAHLDVPLNLGGNSRNAFHRSLTSTRANAVARARTLPVLPNPGMGGR